MGKRPCCSSREDNGEYLCPQITSHLSSGGRFLLVEQVNLCKKDDAAGGAGRPYTPEGLHQKTQPLQPYSPDQANLLQ
jgi:hypothetical protein